MVSNCFKSSLPPLGRKLLSSVSNAGFPLDGSDDQVVYYGSGLPTSLYFRAITAKTKRRL